MARELKPGEQQLVCRNCGFEHEPNTAASPFCPDCGVRMTLLSEPEVKTAWRDITIQCPFCEARSPIEGMRERIRETMAEKGFALPAGFDSMSDDQLVRLGHDLTYPGSVDLDTLELKQAGHSKDLCLI